eukprot:g14576.t1
MAALADEEPDRENGNSGNGWLQYVDVKPGANLKHALLSPYSSNACLETPGNPLQLFSILGESEGPCVCLYDSNSKSCVKIISSDHVGGGFETLKTKRIGVIHTNHAFYSNELFVAAYSSSVYIFKISSLDDDANASNSKPVALKLVRQFTNLNFQVLDVGISKWTTHPSDDDTLSLKDSYVLVLGGSAGAFMYTFETQLLENDEKDCCVVENSLLRQLKSSQYCVSNVAVGHVTNLVSMACKDGRCMVLDYGHGYDKGSTVTSEYRISTDKTDGRITDLAFNSDDTLLIVSFWPGHVYVYKPAAIETVGNKASLWLQTYCLPSINLTTSSDINFPRFSPSMNPTVFSVAHLGKHDVVFIYQGRFDRWVVVDPRSGRRYFLVERMIGFELKRLLSPAREIGGSDDYSFHERISAFCITAIKCFHRESHEKTVNNCIREDCNFEIEFVCLTNKKVYQFRIRV